MPQRQLQPADRAKLDAYIKQLETKLSADLSDEVTRISLLKMLESYLPEQDGLGAYTDCQKQIFQRVTEPDLRAADASSQEIAKLLRTCTDILEHFGVHRQINITQIYQGTIHTVGGKLAFCDERHKLFQDKNIISGLCWSCYKVQALPSNFEALVKLHFIMKYIELPRDNSRKCMVDLRQYSPYAYKGYIYCQSEEEAAACLDIVQAALDARGIADIALGISRGCTEFGLQFPEYKFSADGSHRSFERPPSWDKQEAEFFASFVPSYVRSDFNTQGIAIRDLICIQNWYHYAQVIGDTSAEEFGFLAVDNPLEELFSQVAPQAQQRRDELAELNERLQASA